jgi:hypothetical protein
MKQRAWTKKGIEVILKGGKPTKGVDLDAPNLFTESILLHFKT